MFWFVSDFELRILDFDPANVLGIVNRILYEKRMLVTNDLVSGRYRDCNTLFVHFPVRERRKKPLTPFFSLDDV